MDFGSFLSSNHSIGSDLDRVPGYLCLITPMLFVCLRGMIKGNSGFHVPLQAARLKILSTSTEFGFGDVMFFIYSAVLRKSAYNIINNFRGWNFGRLTTAGPTY